MEDSLVHLNRRDFLVGTGAATATLALGLPVQAAPSDTMRLGMGAAQVVTIDPIYLNQGVDNWAITHVFDLLARAPLGRFAKSPDEFTPELAESWTISSDAKAWTFNLRKGVQVPQGLWRMHVRGREVQLRPRTRPQVRLGERDPRIAQGRQRADARTNTPR